MQAAGVQLLNWFGMAADLTATGATTSKVWVALLQLHSKLPESDDQLLHIGRQDVIRQLIQRQFAHGQGPITPALTPEFLMLEHEVFYCLFLDNRHPVLKAEPCFQGSIDGATVFTRVNW